MSDVDLGVEVEKIFGLGIESVHENEGRGLS